MIAAEWVGVMFTAAFVAVCCVGARYLRVQPSVRQLVCIALVLRVVGAQLYYATFSWSSYGGGDYGMYFDVGVWYSEQLMEGRFDVLTDASRWVGGHWYGTQFVFYVSALVVTVLGPSLRGAFTVFALLGFIGLLAFAVAFRRATPGVPLTRYLAWLCLFPSLWFWPATLGKEAILLMGLGISVLGYVGTRGRMHWSALAIGLFFVFAIRPQVAAVVVLAIVLGQMITAGGRWTARRGAQSALVAGLGFWLLWRALESIGAGFDAQGMEGYVSQRAAATAAEGGSTVPTGTGLAGALLGLFNILFRPLPWEARGIPGLIASVEIWGFWLLVWLHRGGAWAAVRQLRSNRLVAMGIPFILLYATTLGMSVANLGIIARQRIFLFPFLFLLFVVSGRREHAERRVAAFRASPRGHLVPSA